MKGSERKDLIEGSVSVRTALTVVKKYDVASKVTEAFFLKSGVNKLLRWFRAAVNPYFSKSFIRGIVEVKDAKSVERRAISISKNSLFAVSLLPRFSDAFDYASAIFRKSESVKITADLFGARPALRVAGIIICIAICTNIVILIFVSGTMNISGLIARMCCILLVALLIGSKLSPRTICRNSAILKSLGMK